METPSAIKQIRIRGSSTPLISSGISAAAERTPTTGVQSPTTRRTAMIDEMTEAVPATYSTFPCRTAMQLCNKRSPSVTLSSKSPLPGQPFGKVEKRRCRGTPSLCNQSKQSSHPPKRQIGQSVPTPLGLSEINDPSLEGNRNGMRPVVRSEL